MPSALIDARCKHCRRRGTVRQGQRGLCRVCHDDEAVRGSYPPLFPGADKPRCGACGLRVAQGRYRGLCRICFGRGRVKAAFPTLVRAVEFRLPEPPRCLWCGTSDPARVVLPWCGSGAEVIHACQECRDAQAVRAKAARAVYGPGGKPLAGAARCERGRVLCGGGGA